MWSKKNRDLLPAFSPLYTLSPSMELQWNLVAANKFAGIHTMHWITYRYCRAHYNTVTTVAFQIHVGFVQTDPNFARDWLADFPTIGSLSVRLEKEGVSPQTRI